MKRGAQIPHNRHITGRRHLRSETGDLPVKAQGELLPQSMRWTAIEEDAQPQHLPPHIHAQMVYTYAHVGAHIHTTYRNTHHIFA